MRIKLPSIAIILFLKINIFAQLIEITSPNPILCGSNTAITLSTSFVSSNYIWYKKNLVTNQTSVINGAIGSSISVTDIGGYSVTAQNGNSSNNSNILYVTYGGQGTLLNSSNNTNTVVLPQGQSTENLKVNLSGVGPWEVGLFDGIAVKKYTSNTSQLIIPVSPTKYTTYSIDYVLSNCGSDNKINQYKYLSVTPSPMPTISFPNPVGGTTVCVGNIINIPYTITGNLGNELELGLLLAAPTGGESRQVYNFTRMTLDPLNNSGTFPFFIPQSIQPGLYSIYIVTFNQILQLGNTVSGLFTNYTLNVVNTGCNPTPSPTISGLSTGCEKVILTTIPNNAFFPTEFNFQWYKNGIIIPNETNNQLLATETGNYSVNIFNGSYNQTSANKSVTINSIRPNISSSSAGNCLSTLSTNFTNPSYTYQWYKEKIFPNGSIDRIPVFGQTSSSITVSEIGNYSIKVWDGNCQNSSNNYTQNSCPIIECSPDVLVPVVAGTLSSLATYNLPTSIGSTILQTSGINSGNNFPFGTTINTFSATNSFGNVNSCSFKVIVYDQTAPTVQNSIIPNAIPDATTGNYSISSALFDVTIPSGETVTGLLIYAFPIGAESITINGITYGPPTAGARINISKVDLIPFPAGGVIAITDNLGKPVDPIIVNPLPNINQLNVEYFATNSNNIQSPLPATLTINFGSAPLPLNLLSFKGKTTEKGNELTWKTTNETNFSHFEIQKSDNGKEFGAIGNVNSNESGFYSFTDTNPNEGVNYYKLRIIDHDGTFTFSKTISVNFEKNGYYLSVENPAKNGEFLVRSNYTNASFTLLNSLGQKMIISVTELAENQYKIKSKNVNRGIYFLMVESDGKLITRKVLME